MSKSAPQNAQGTAVALNGRAILLIGSPGMGKSELAMALIDQGASLVADDLVHLRAYDGQIMVASMLPPRGSIAIREIGLVQVEQVIEAIPLSLVIELKRADLVENGVQFGPRSLGQFGPVEGLYCPMLTLDPRSPTIAIKVRLALERWGH